MNCPPPLVVAWIERSEIQELYNLDFAALNPGYILTKRLCAPQGGLPPQSWTPGRLVLGTSGVEAVITLGEAGRIERHGQAVAAVGQRRGEHDLVALRIVLAHRFGDRELETVEQRHRDDIVCVAWKFLE